MAPGKEKKQNSTPQSHRAFPPPALVSATSADSLSPVSPIASDTLMLTDIVS